MQKRTRTAGPEYVSPTGISWCALKCRLGAGLSPYEIGACIGRRECDVLQAMKDYDLHTYKKPAKVKQPAYVQSTMPDGRVVTRHYLTPEIMVIAIYKAIMEGNTVQEAAKIARAHPITTANFIKRNNL